METNVGHIVVEPRPGGRWAVQRNGTKRAASLHDTQAAAEEEAKRWHTELVTRTVRSSVVTATAATPRAGQDE